MDGLKLFAGISPSAIPFNPDYLIQANWQDLSSQGIMFDNQTFWFSDQPAGLANTDGILPVTVVEGFPAGGFIDGTMPIVGTLDPQRAIGEFPTLALQSPDGNNTYIHSSVNAVNHYQSGIPSTVSGRVAALAITIMEQHSAGIATTTITVNGVEFAGVDSRAQSGGGPTSGSPTAWAAIRFIIPAEPVSGLPWTPATLNTAVIGIKANATGDGSYTTQMFPNVIFQGGGTGMKKIISSHSVGTLPHGFGPAQLVFCTKGIARRCRTLPMLPIRAMMKGKSTYVGFDA